MPSLKKRILLSPVVSFSTLSSENDRHTDEADAGEQHRGRLRHRDVIARKSELAAVEGLTAAGAESAWPQRRAEPAELCTKIDGDMIRFSEWRVKRDHLIVEQIEYDESAKITYRQSDVIGIKRRHRPKRGGLSSRPVDTISWSQLGRGIDR